MSGLYRRFSAEFKVEASHRVIDTGRQVAEVTRELTLGDALLGGWVRTERARMEAAKGTELEPHTGLERAELLLFRKQVSELEKDNAFLEKSVCTSQRIHQSGAICFDGSGVRELLYLAYGSVAERVKGMVLPVASRTESCRADTA